MEQRPQQSVEPIFHAACEHAQGAERQAFLAGACGADAQLRERVEALLAAHEEASGFLAEPAVASSREGPGSTIDGYKLLQELGEGGMGVVYMAEQERPVRRKVAIKVIKLGMDTKQVIARFEAERQALALMDHENIARVFDAGSTESGRPYFVMELVRGVPIHEYCDTHKLSTNDRLELFGQVCRAVQHAHQKGIIHRDLKPTNVMVTSHDGRPVPKIIDFGVAKATNQKLTERTLFTEYHQIIGTLEYMSPEQAEMSGLDVDTRSDIYSLGVLLYQLLTGKTPADPGELRTAAFSEMTRMIREDEPLTPSTRISKMGEDGEHVARQHSSDVRTLSRHCRGDLDWIVMKALEKDRTRRYETASAFAKDIARHLENLPVEAGPPGVGYRLAKFVRRNQRAVAAALVLLTILGLGLAGTGAGFLRASAEAQRSRAISDSLEDVLAMTQTADAELERVLASVRETFGASHATYAAVLDTLALRMYDAGEFETSAELSGEALAIWMDTYGEVHANVATSMARLGSAQRANGSDVEAQASLRAALMIVEQLPNAPVLAGYDARVELADLLANIGEYAAADELLVEALAQLRETTDPAHFRILTVLEQRYIVQTNLADSVAAGATIREIYAEAREYCPEGSPVLAVTALGLGRHLAQHGELEAAEPFLREAVRRFRANPNPPKMFMFAASDTLFQILRSREDPESVAEANALLRDVLGAGRSFLGTDVMVASLRFYAGRMREVEEFGEGLTALLDAHQLLVDAGRSVGERENLRDNLTMFAFEIARHPGLEPELYSRARVAAELALEVEPEHAAMLTSLGAVLYRQGEYELSAEKLDQAQPLSGYRGGLARAIAPNDHAFRAMAHTRLGHKVRALAELETLRALLEGRTDGDQPPVLLREVESLLRDTSSSNEGD